MNHENEVKDRWIMPGRHVQLKILPYNKYSWPVIYSLRKTDQNTKTQLQPLNPENEVKDRWHLPIGQVHLIAYMHIPN